MIDNINNEQLYIDSFTDIHPNAGDIADAVDVLIDKVSIPDALNISIKNNIMEKCALFMK